MGILILWGFLVNVAAVEIKRPKLPLSKESDVENYDDSSSFYNVVLDCRLRRDDSDLAKGRAVGMERGQNLVCPF